MGRVEQKAVSQIKPIPVWKQFHYLLEHQKEAVYAVPLRQLEREQRRGYQIFRDRGWERRKKEVCMQTSHNSACCVVLRFCRGF